MKQDLRYAVRSLRRAPGFSATVVATLALGIGANSVIFSAVDAILLRDAPVTDPDTVVDVYTSSGSTLHSRSSYPDYFDLRDSGTFASLAAYTEVPITMDANGQPEPVAGELVSGNYFEVLGITMALGRGFAPHEDRIGAPVRAAVISHALWQRVFNADRSLIGRTIRLNSNSVYAHRRRPTGVRRSRPRRRDGRLGANAPSARSGSGISRGAALAWSPGQVRPAQFTRIENGRSAAGWRQHRGGGGARGSHCQPPPDCVPGYEPQPAIHSDPAWRGPRPSRQRRDQSCASLRAQS